MQPHRSSLPGPGLASVRFVIAVSLVVMTGSVLPLAWGLAVPAVLLSGLAWLLVRRSGAGDAEVPAGRATAVQAVAQVALVGFPLVAFAAIAARAVTAMVVAFPASLWTVFAFVGVTLAATVFPGVTSALFGSRARVLVVFLVAAVGLVGAAVGGTFFEAGSEHGRGWAQSGPIHGIHPFQTTAIVIDGHGPFDLPINDYVEPDGSRGYGPEALAEALERALHRIAVVHFSPTSLGHKAFAEARVEATFTPPVLETWGDDVPDERQARLVIWSGTVGPGSRVEFVCPGRREDPRPFPGESIESKMCPSKYASEASAGLGVTGRWPGYAEGWGTPRWTWLVLPEGAREQARALAIGACGVLVLGGLISLRGRGVMMASGLATTSATILLLAWVIAIAAALRSWHVEAWSSGAGAAGAQSWSWWIFAALSSGSWGLWRARERGRGFDFAIAGAVAWVTVATVWTCGRLDALAWVHPVLGLVDGSLPFERFIEGMARDVMAPWGLDVQVAQAIVAGLLEVLLLGFSVVAFGSIGRAIGEVSPESSAAKWPFVVQIASVLVASGLTFSHVTDGAARLFPGALGLTVLLSTSLALWRAHELAIGRRRVLQTGHVLAAAVTVVGLVQTAGSVDMAHPFAWLCLGAGGLVLLGCAWPRFWSRPRRP